MSFWEMQEVDGAFAVTGFGDSGMWGPMGMDSVRATKTPQPSPGGQAATPQAPAMPAYPYVPYPYPFGAYAPYGTPPSGSWVPGVPMTEEQLIAEQSYVENILRFNKGKVATVYLSYTNNPEWPAKVVRGVVQTAGRDFLILSDPDTGKRYLLLMVNVDWVEFDEPIRFVAPRVPPYVQYYIEESK